MTILSTSPRVVRPRLGSPPASWQESMKLAVRDPVELCRLLKLPEKYSAAAQNANRQFPLFAPREFIARMQPGDITDPLLRQVLPIDAETCEVPGFATDPVGDEFATRQAGLIQKYGGR